MSQTSSPAASERRKQLEYLTSITKLYSRHASTLFACFDQWKDDDRYYFIELRLDMAYVSTSGLVARIADPPYFLGTIVRNSIQNPGLFGDKCPEGHQAYAYSYTGSPLSGSVSQAVACPVCGWNQWTQRFGWHDRSRILKVTRAEDLERYHRLTESDSDFRPADLRELLSALGLPEEELILPRIEPKIEKSEYPGCTIWRDPYGGVKIQDTEDGTTTYYQWHWLDE